jgi:hypothetical protein
MAGRSGVSDRKRPGRALAAPLRFYWRTALAVVVMVGICISQIGGSVGANADSSFYAGTASVLAQAITFGPVTGGLSAEFNLAQTVADFELNDGQAEAQTLNAGAIGLSLTSPPCPGNPAAIPKQDLPQPVTIETTSGPTSGTLTLTQSQSATTGGAGVEQAEVSTKPSATSTATLASINLPGILQVSGATSTGTVDILNGDTRSAIATADVAAISLLGGLIELKGLHWDSTQQSGALNTSVGTFSIGSLTIAGTSVPVATPSELGTALTLINTVLEPTGLTFALPQTTIQSDGTVVVTPLSVGIVTSPIGQQTIGATLGPTEPVRNEVDNIILGLNCKYGSELSIADIVIAALAGGGSFYVSFGGTNAVTNGTEYADAFGTGGGGTFGGSPFSAASNGFDDTGTFNVPSTVLGGNLGGGSTTTSSTGPPGQRVVAIGPTSKTSSCTSLGPAGGSCNTSNDALAAGLAGLGAVLFLFAWDFARQRRRRRLVEEVAL